MSAVSRPSLSSFVTRIQSPFSTFNMISSNPLRSFVEPDILSVKIRQGLTPDSLSTFI